MSRLDVALIGAGFIARTHMAAWIALGARIRIFSTDGQAALLAEEFGLTEAASLPAALDGAAIADICTPTTTHHDIALAAFEAGAHVLCEKPLALTPKDAQHMSDAAHEAGRLLYPGHVVRFFPAYVRLRDAVTSGALGRVAVARFTRTGRYPTWSNWFTDPALSGGIVTDQMLHDMDIARWLFGDVVTVHATQRGRPHAPEGPVATGSATLTHDSGVISQVLGVWGPPATPFRYTFHIAGSHGTLTHDSLAHPSLRVTGAAGAQGDGVPTGDFGEDPFATQIRELAAAFQGGPAPRVSALDGVAAVRIAAAARQSAATGLAVAVDDAYPLTLTEGSPR
ncbi:Gfo/Idh/MocA family oxidoreductase [Streptomyces sp. HUCO-GS316]|uniref:Gfo/Idh/MocA family protein n=1 Tax=Streptomyces sp. HUCO-GS316 TaxID=2692198 RepID=UPI001368CE26|nr:Gfo/Idh/MocA family oxidoreductase [Streptomyces sp. HUCO-GS316]MXM66147.1 Gfo/Idh/MocA family oxidoreductase [Streptomyces sp. HUCO-GS316]